MLQRWICVVTGGSRGIGKGIALQLSENGATVYITGRNPEQLQQAAEEVSSRGGQCIPVSCDSTKEEEIKQLFKKVRQEQGGRLDILVNSAFGGIEDIFAHKDTPFWEAPLHLWDNNNSTIRGHYVAVVQAAQLMVAAKHGLIVMISSMGAINYNFSVPYGVGKAACDRMMSDCAVELKKHNVACISLWPGATRTELVNKHVLNNTSLHMEPVMRRVFAEGETPEFAGRCIAHLATDKNIMRKSGKSLMTCDVGDEYGFYDVDGKRPINYNSVSFILSISQFTILRWISNFIPRFIKVPKLLLTLGTHRL